MRSTVISVLLTLVAAVSCGSEDAAQGGCLAGETVCVGAAVHVCEEDGSTTRFVVRCPEGSACSSGRCVGFSQTDASPDPGDLADTATLPDTAPDADGPADATSDAPPDTARDTAPDTTPDTVPDTAPDTTPDTAPDTTPDTAPDTTPDTTPDTAPDTAPDTTPDMAPDTAPDTTPDTAPDTAPDTTPDTAPDTTPDPGPPPTPFLFADYTKVPNLALSGDVVDIAYVPGGEGDALVATRGEIGKVPGAGGAASLLADAGKTTLSRVGFAPGFTGALVVGWDPLGGRLLRVDPDTGATEELPGSPVSGNRFTALVSNPEGGFWALATDASTAGITRIYAVDGGEAGPQLQAALTTGWVALSDAVWAQSPLIYEGAPFLWMLFGGNGAGSRSYVPAISQVVQNGWKGGFGNPGRAAWRPGGRFGIAAGWTSNVVYVFDGTWQSEHIPSGGSALSPNAIAFSPSGNLAVAVGRAGKSPLLGTVLFYENLGGTYDLGTWEAWGIPGFGEPPYSADGNVHLQAVRFQPDSTCGEGLIGATQPKGSPFALIVRFRTAPCP